MEVILMKPVGLISSGVLLLLLGALAPTYAQQDQHQQDAKPPKQEQQQQQRAPQQQQAKGQQQQRAPQQQQAKGQPPQRAPQQQQAKGQQQQRAPQQQQAKGQQQQRAPQQQQANRPSPQQMQQQQAAWQGHRARNWQSEHRDWQQRGGYHGYRIPEDRYRGHFGRDHWFRIYSYPVVVVGGYPRFQYGGFLFSIVDPWPEYWSDDWYDNDDVYIDYSGDGYYLYNRRYPQDRIAVTVYVN